eukprot:Rmarinus@m.5927
MTSEIELSFSQPVMSTMEASVPRKSAKMIKQDLSIWLHASHGGRRWIWIQNSITVVACLLYVVETYTEEDEGLQSFIPHHPILLAKLTILLDFFVDYVLHIVAAEHPRAYIYSMFGLVDLLAFLPLFDFFFTLPASLAFVWFLRLFKAARVLGWERFVYRGRSAISRKVLGLLLTVASLLLCATGVVHLISRLDPDAFTDGGNKILQFHNAFYFVLVTVTTVGYGDVTPVSTAARLVMMVTILLFFALLPNRVQQLIAVLERKVKYRDPIIVTPTSRYVVLCGSFDVDGVRQFLNEILHIDHYPVNRHLMVVLLHAETPSVEIKNLLNLPEYGRRTRYYHGSALDVEDLSAVGLASAAAVFVVSSRQTNEGEKHDRLTVLRTMAIQRYLSSRNSFAQLFVQLNRPSDLMEEVLRGGGVHGVLCTQKLKMNVIAKSIVFPGFSTLICNLVSSHTPSLLEDDVAGHWIDEYYRGATHEVYRVLLSPNFHGMSFLEGARAIYACYGVVLIGVETCEAPRESVTGMRNTQASSVSVRLNPGSSYTLQSHSYAFVVAQDATLAARVSEWTVESESVIFPSEDITFRIPRVRRSCPRSVTIRSESDSNISTRRTKVVPASGKDTSSLSRRALSDACHVVPRATCSQSPRLHHEASRKGLALSRRTGRGSEDPPTSARVDPSVTRTKRGDIASSCVETEVCLASNSTCDNKEKRSVEPDSGVRENVGGSGKWKASGVCDKPVCDCGATGREGNIKQSKDTDIEGEKRNTACPGETVASGSRGRETTDPKSPPSDTVHERDGHHGARSPSPRESHNDPPGRSMSRIEPSISAKNSEDVNGIPSTGRTDIRKDSVDIPSAGGVSPPQSQGLALEKSRDDVPSGTKPDGIAGNSGSDDLCSSRVSAYRARVSGQTSGNEISTPVSGGHGISSRCNPENEVEGGDFNPRNPRPQTSSNSPNIALAHVDASGSVADSPESVENTPLLGVANASGSCASEEGEDDAHVRNLPLRDRGHSFLSLDGLSERTPPTQEAVVASVVATMGVALGEMGSLLPSQQIVTGSKLSLEDVSGKLDKIIRSLSKCERMLEKSVDGPATAILEIQSTKRRDISDHTLVMGDLSSADDLIRGIRRTKLNASIPGLILGDNLTCRHPIVLLHPSRDDIAQLRLSLSPAEQKGVYHVVGTSQSSKDLKRAGIRTMMCCVILSSEGSIHPTPMDTRSSPTDGIFVSETTHLPPVAVWERPLQDSNALLTVLEVQQIVRRGSFDPRVTTRLEAPTSWKRRGADPMFSSRTRRMMVDLVHVSNSTFFGTECVGATLGDSNVGRGVSLARYLEGNCFGSATFAAGDIFASPLLDMPLICQACFNPHILSIVDALVSSPPAVTPDVASSTASMPGASTKESSKEEGPRRGFSFSRPSDPLSAHVSLIQVAVPRELAGSPYADVFFSFLDEGLLCLGLYRAPGPLQSSLPWVATNPLPTTTVSQSDRVFVLAGH